jgi:hypothetical protein
MLTGPDPIEVFYTAHVLAPVFNAGLEPFYT